MHHQIARRQRGEFGQEGVGALAAFLAADQPVAQNILLGDQLDLGAAEAALERQHQRDRGSLGGEAERLLPAISHDRRRPHRLAQNRCDPRAASLRIGGDQRFFALRGLSGQIARGRLVHIVTARAFGGEIAAAGKAEVDHAGTGGLREYVRTVDRLRGASGVEFGAGQVECLSRERAVATRLLARAFGPRDIVIGDVAQPFVGCTQRGSVDDHGVLLAQVIEQRDQPVLKQR